MNSLRSCQFCNEDLKTQQTPKEEAQVPLAVPPAASHSLELGRETVQLEKGGIVLLEIESILLTPTGHIASVSCQMNRSFLPDIPDIIMILLIETCSRFHCSRLWRSTHCWGTSPVEEFLISVY